MNFLELRNLEELLEIEKMSFLERQVIFKHSTRCIISKMALQELKYCTALNINVWVLDLLEYKEISNHISLKYSLTHQSPQILIIENGELINSASHEQISCELIEAKHEK